MVDYPLKAKEARLKILDMVFSAQSSHIGSNFSVIDILTVLFDHIDLKKDVVILSAGWKAASFYYFLKQKGHDIDLDSYCKEGSNLIGLTEPGIPGVRFAGGSMCMGLLAAVGFAFSKKMKGEEGKVYCIMSDGEMQGGMVWESALIATQHRLNNLVILVDKNGLQAMGKTGDILDIDLIKLFHGFGWAVYNLDGHDFKQFEKSLLFMMGTTLEQTPKIIICNTIKGKGVSFMENNNEWHYRNISEEIYLKAKAELNGQT